jgi:hypothetical protein
MRATLMQTRYRLIAFALAAAASTFAQAAPASTPATPLSSCVDLTAGHESFRFGSQYLLVRDGDHHYRMSFGGNCDALLHGTVAIDTKGTANQLCPSATRVSARTYACQVRSIDEIDAAAYDRYRAKAGR